MTDTKVLIEALIDSNSSLVAVTEQTNENVRQLTDSVNELIVDRAVRVEHDIAQHKHNEQMLIEIQGNRQRFDLFLDTNRQNLFRLDRWYKLQDKVAVPLVGAIIFGILALLGFDWKR